MSRWYIVYKFGYSDTDSQILEFDYEIDEEDVKTEAASVLEMDEEKITYIEKLED